MERIAEIVHSMRFAWKELDDGEDEIVGLVQRGKNFVLGDRDDISAGHTAFHLDETELPRARHAALYVVAHFVEFAIDGIESELALDFHDDGAGAGGAGLGVNRANGRI